MNYSRKHCKHLAYIEKFRIRAALYGIGKGYKLINPQSVKIRYKLITKEIQETSQIDPCFRNQRG